MRIGPRLQRPPLNVQASPGTDLCVAKEAHVPVLGVDGHTDVTDVGDVGDVGDDATSR